MQNNPTHSIIEALKDEEQKREAFLDQMVYVIENTLPKLKVKSNDDKEH